MELEVLVICGNQISNVTCKLDATVRRDALIELRFERIVCWSQNATMIVELSSELSDFLHIANALKFIPTIPITIYRFDKNVAPMNCKHEDVFGPLIVGDLERNEARSV